MAKRMAFVPMMVNVTCQNLLKEEGRPGMTFTVYAEPLRESKTTSGFFGDMSKVENVRAKIETAIVRAVGGSERDAKLYSGNELGFERTHADFKPMFDRVSDLCVLAEDRGPDDHLHFVAHLNDRAQLDAFLAKLAS